MVDSSSSPDLDGHCIHCGSPQEAYGGLGFLALLHPTDVAALCLLFSEMQDTIPCEACGRSSGVTGSICLVDLEGSRLYVALGTRMQARSDELWSEFEEVARRLGKSFVAIRCESLDVLRDVARGLLRPWFQQVLECLNTSDNATLQERVSSLDLRNFAAVEIGRRVPWSGLHVTATARDGSAKKVADPYVTIAQLQALSWISMLRRWLNNKPERNPLGSDLSSHVASDAVLPGADAAAFALLEGMECRKTYSPRGQYLIEALRAAIHAACGTTNPHAPKWAAMYFGLGMQLHLGTEDGEAEARRLTITERQARETIDFEAAWDAIVGIASSVPPGQTAKVLEALETIATRAGHADLLPQIKEHGMKVVVPDPTAEKLVDMFRIAREQHAGPDDAESRAGLIAVLGQSLAESGRIGEMELAVATLLAQAPSDDAFRAHLWAWLGKCMKEQRQPERFLKLAGEHPAPWEHNLDVNTRVPLWNERLNAMRLMGRTKEALAMSETAMALLPQLPPSYQRVARMNHAILLRDAGDPEASIAELRALLSDAKGPARIPLLQSIAAGHSLLGQEADAARCYDEILKWSKGPMARHAEPAKATAALGRVLDDRYEEAIQLLLELNVCERLDPFILFPVASCWVILKARGVALPSDATPAIRQCCERLSALWELSNEHGDVQGMLGALRLLALLFEHLGLTGQANVLWAQLLEVAEEVGQPPGMHELLSVSRIAYDTGNAEHGRNVLLQLPLALGSTISGVTELGLVSMRVEREIKSKLDQLTRAVLSHGSSDGGSFDDIRLIAEMRRDVVARAKRAAGSAMRDAELAALSRGLTDAVISRLAPGRGQVAVHEWLETGSEIASMLTVIDAAGAVASHWLEPCEVDLESLAAKMRRRLRDWTPSRPGDPFDHPPWIAFEQWLNAELGRRLETNAHVIFIEHDEYAGLPWHAAVAERWTASYAAGWGRLLALADTAAAPARQLGLAVVPRYGESAEVAQALRESAERTLAAASAHTVPLRACEGTACDVSAMASLLSASDVVMLLCHGFVATAEQEVAVMVARSGALPPAHSVAAGTAAAQGHRFGWRQCAALDKAPSVVFSAACSSNMSHVVGLGDRLGLYGGLAKAGTRSLVAPQWDVVAIAFLRILERAFEQHVFNAVPLAHAVRNACREAQNRHPRWMCWALSIEGDWR